MAKKTIHNAGDVTVEVPDGSTVRMKRNAEQWPPHKYGPSSADVHIDEVENWAAHGWEIDKEPEGPAAD